MTTATIARAGFTIRRQLTVKEDPPGYWVMYYRVRYWSRFFWNGRWYHRGMFNESTLVDRPQEEHYFTPSHSVFVTDMGDCDA